MTHRISLLEMLSEHDDSSLKLKHREIYELQQQIEALEANVLEFQRIKLEFEKIRLELDVPSNLKK